MINWFKKLFSKQEEKEECPYMEYIEEQDEHYLQKQRDSEQSNRTSKATKDR